MALLSVLSSLFLFEGIGTTVVGALGMLYPHESARAILSPKDPGRCPLTEELIRLAGVVLVMFGMLLGHGAATDLLHRAGRAAHTHFREVLAIVTFGDLLQVWVCYKLHQAMGNVWTTINMMLVAAISGAALLRIVWLGAEPLLRGRRSPALRRTAKQA